LHFVVAREVFDLERTVKNPVQFFIDEKHQPLCRVPCVHKNGAIRQRFMMMGVFEHLFDVIHLRLAVCIRLKQPPVDGPELIGVGSDDLEKFKCFWNEPLYDQIA
jgi:hypothetical protein